MRGSNVSISLLGPIYVNVQNSQLQYKLWLTNGSKNGNSFCMDAFRKFLPRPGTASFSLRRASFAAMTQSTQHPLSGLWKPTQLQAMQYGPSSVEKHLLSYLPSQRSKAFIITGSSLATKTSLISQVESLLGPSHHAGTFASIKQHAPVAEIDEAADAVLNNDTIDTLISIGGGSPIDAAKAISYRSKERAGKFLFHITIPTTLSAAECTLGAGYTSKEGKKVTVASPELTAHVIIYDATFAKETPKQLWMSTAIRSLDHAVELLYHPYATEYPAKQSGLTAAASLFENLPIYNKDPGNEDCITRLQLAAFASLSMIGLNFKAPLGLSHTLGYALGSPYGIPHGVTSCLTLASVVRLKAESDRDAEQIARILPFIGQQRSGDNRADAKRVGDAIDDLLKELGLDTSLRDHGVGEDQVSTIVKTATGSQEGDLYDKVASLIRSKL